MPSSGGPAYAALTTLATPFAYFFAGTYFTVLVFSPIGCWFLTTIALYLLYTAVFAEAPCALSDCSDHHQECALR